MFELRPFPQHKEAWKLPLKDAEIYYYSKFISPLKASELFRILMEETPWQQDTIKVFGKTYPQPRLTALYASNQKSYIYSGIVMDPTIFTPALRQLKLEIESKISETFTTALLNLYRDGEDSNGWHSDNEKELGKNPVIASISLGSERYFHLKHRKEPKERYKILLEHGSLLLMKGPTQHCWLHQLPKSKKVTTSRINITFRSIF